jgi:Protein of unknown function (DUF3253)
MASLEDIAAEILRQAVAAGPGKTVAPMDIAQTLHADEDWQSLLPAVRRAAVTLARAGTIAIYRKGKPVDPNDFKGVYRLGLPPRD